MRSAVLLLASVLLAREASAQGVDFKLDTQFTFYGDNTEFTNPFAVGVTTLGIHGTVVGEARTSARLAIRFGVYGNQVFGSSRGFDDARPVISLVIGPKSSRLIMGTLSTVRRADGIGPDRTTLHGQLPPVQVETLSFERPWEPGLQWLVDTARYQHDAWVHWQRVNTVTQREIFDAGWSSRLRLNRAATMRADMFERHQGGQRTTLGAVSDSWAGTFGLDVGGPAGPLDRVGLEALVLGSRYVPDRADLSSARSGFATFLRASVEEGHWRFHGLLFRGDDFIAVEGDPLYQSVQRDHREVRSLRDYAEAGATRLFPLAKDSWLEASVRWHRAENHYGYSYRILSTVGFSIP
jgi:hypothetical protein